MAVAMEKAFSETLKKIIVPHDVSKDETLRKGLICIDCKIEITFRKEHERNKHIISAGFIRKKGIEHKPTCSYNTLGQISIIAQNSDDNVLESINDSKYDLRLTLIHKSLNNVLHNPQITEHKQSNKYRKQDLNYLSNGNLSSYLATMKKIIELRNLLEDKKELHPIVEISCHNSKVKWEDFYYEPERYLNAHRYLKKLKWEERHPICIEGIIHEIPYVEKLGMNVINLQWGDTELNSNGITLIPTISVLINNKELMELSFKKGQRIAICALCTHGISKGKGTGREFFNIKAGLYHKNQVVIF